VVSYRQIGFEIFRPVPLESMAIDIKRDTWQSRFNIFPMYVLQKQGYDSSEKVEVDHPAAQCI